MPIKMQQLFDLMFGGYTDEGLKRQAVIYFNEHNKEVE
jgi:hypothetical protein